MKIKSNPPYAPNLVESMRSIGYSFDTALADIIDNSIVANASKIDILSSALNENSYIAILDNGYGMNSNELFNSMQYGSTNPNKDRNKNDMGRFGLGLKSASLSQCRRLTVVSKNNNKYSGMVWDIDYIIKSHDWNLLVLEDKELEAIPEIGKLKKYNSGTLVVWQNLDKIKSTSMDTNEYLKELLVSSIDHFSLIFHRLLNSSLQIYVNGISVTARDPFLENNSNTQRKREQKIKIDNNTIIVKPFILPHVNKLTTEDIKKVGGKESLRTEQGFYIYRNKRLIIWGTWFRLGYKNELTKLARVRVDIPNSMDYLWDIDIKKSRAILPEKIKINLYNAVIQSCNISERVHVYKGRKINNDNNIHTWNVIEKRKEDGLGIEINLNNPLIIQFIDTLDANQKKYFITLIEDIEQTLPLDFIYTQIAKGYNTDSHTESNKDKELFEEFKSRIETAVAIGLDKNQTIDILKHHERYSCNKLIQNNIETLKKIGG